MSKELETKRNEIVKQASSFLKEAAEHLRAASASLATEPEKAASVAAPAVVTEPTDVEALKQAFLKQIADDEAELARLEAELQA